ncbi:LysR family transcriptional regulator [Phenylobacterium sp.]|uniref:LysR family transcriptional regulator n=1 Tax=Phenylobacterium sp. TaxID=1871053 RepID=UPI0035B2E06E
MDLLDVSVFVAAVEAGSLAGAARRCGVPALTASRRLAALEKALGARLMHRTTRALALTGEGEKFLPFARGLLEAEAGARAALAGDPALTGGLLRLTASAAFGRLVLTPIIAGFLREHPRLEIDLMLTDAMVDVVGQGLDLAIRIAEMRDSSLVARRVGDSPRGLYAAPGYLARSGTPAALADLERHQCLPLAGTTHWSFRSGERTVRLRARGRLSINSVDALREACVAGAGVAMLSDWHVQADLAEGRLVELSFPATIIEPLGIWAVLPSSRMAPPRTRLFVDHLARTLRARADG